MSNGNTNWTYVILGIFAMLVMWITPSPILRNSNGFLLPIPAAVPDSTAITVDTVYLPAVPVSGSSGSTVTAQPNTHIPEFEGGQELDIPYYFEKEDSGFTEQAKVYIRTTVYPYKENDTLKAFISNEWKVEARPMEIVKVDTVFKYITKYVEVEKPVPFLEKPEVLIPVTAIVVYGIVKGIEALFASK